MIRYVGQLDRDGVNALYGSARAGIMIYQPADNAVDARPNKLFEYMAAGLPAIASDFPWWRQIIDSVQCGICVDPTDPAAVRNACQYLLDHPKEGWQMGKNGHQAVMEKWNWSVEEKKLLSLYEAITKA